jgi:hypothetical protein
MPELVLHTETFTEGYRLTTTAGTLRIEPAGAMQYPFTLDRVALARFGLWFIDDHYLEVQSSPEATGIVDAMLGTIGRAIEVLRTQRDHPAYRWDVENLKRAFVVLGGLDEDGVQRILDEEG